MAIVQYTCVVKLSDVEYINCKCNQLQYCNGFSQEKYRVCSLYTYVLHHTKPIKQTFFITDFSVN